MEDKNWARGRPRFTEEETRRFSVLFGLSQYEFVKSQGGGAFLRKLVDGHIAKQEKKTKRVKS